MIFNSDPWKYLLKIHTTRCKQMYSSENTNSNLKNKQGLNYLSIVKNLRLKNVNKTIIEQININSISSKFDQLE